MEEFRAPYKKLPRKPPRHFSLFMRENFAKIKAENQGMSNPDIMRELGAKWRNLPFSEREEIRRKSEDAQKTYEAEIVEFEDQLSEGEREFLNVQAKDKMKELKQRKMKLLNFPKKPGTAFIYFLTMERESFPRREGEGITQWTQRMAETWRDMSDDEKEMYRMANRRAVEKYNEEVTEWKEKHEKD
ncbi:predicted protein [Nematostella vectensis]|uniref:HMG box domain-containing protein n=1 Tax=Nematostella vectensis TaxID=45351 RepID=A7RP25_NEMVE|nr:predicted protein [Nematostella vectensis]|eukprot:XP_001638901.1 predicted protein [Nematostella vectensis]